MATDAENASAFSICCYHHKCRLVNCYLVAINFTECDCNIMIVCWGAYIVMGLCPYLLPTVALLYVNLSCGDRIFGT